MEDNRGPENATMHPPRSQASKGQGRVVTVPPATTAQHYSLGSNVVFSAGLNINHVLTGFEAISIRLDHIPSVIRRNDIQNCLLSQGWKIQDFHIVEFQFRSSSSSSVAKIVYSSRLNSPDFNTLGNIGDMGIRVTSEDKSSDRKTITFSWLSFTTFVAFYDVHRTGRLEDIRAKTYRGQGIQARNRLPGFDGLLSQGFAIEITGSGLLPEDVPEIAESDFVLLDEDGPDPNHNVIANLAAEVRILAPGWNSTLERVGGGPPGRISVRARFRTYQVARKVYQGLTAVRGRTFDLQVIPPRSSRLDIWVISRQFEAQREQWAALSSSNSIACRLWTEKRTNGVLVCLDGNDKKAVGALKVRAESLAAGKNLAMNHRHFTTSEGIGFLQRVMNTSGVFVRFDHKVKSLRAYGPSSSVKDARDRIKAEMNRLASLDHTVVLKWDAVRFFVEKGLPALHKAIGEGGATLDLSSSPRRLTIHASEEGRFLLNQLLQEAANRSVKRVSGSVAADDCPICFDEISVPLTLECGHTYCTSCIRHLVTNAGDGKIFPLICLGESAGCRSPISLAVIQQLLTAPQFHRLLDVAFASYIEGHPQEYRFCPTPDCEQIYRCGSTGVRDALQCPSCFATICSACHMEAHEGLTCQERLRLRDQDELSNRWIEEQRNVKRCPSCQILIEKIEGCNHMTCKCGSHICWVCMGVFPAQDIYQHMQAAHGSYYEERLADAIPGPAPVLRNAMVAHHDGARPHPFAVQPAFQPPYPRGEAYHHYQAFDPRLLYPQRAINIGAHNPLQNEARRNNMQHERIAPATVHPPRPPLPLPAPLPRRPQVQPEVNRGARVVEIDRWTEPYVPRQFHAAEDRAPLLPRLTEPVSTVASNLCQFIKFLVSLIVVFGFLFLASLNHYDD